MNLYYEIMKTPLGEIICVCDESYVYLLQFGDYHTNKKDIDILTQLLNKEIVERQTELMQRVKLELQLYFSKKLEKFSIPIYLIGTDFQKQVWNELLNIDYGKTISYKELATRIDNPRAIRAVGNANGKNRIVIIVPCHRVIQSNGTLGGYTGGIDYKINLLENEQK